MVFIITLMEWHKKFIYLHHQEIELFGGSESPYTMLKQSSKHHRLDLLTCFILDSGAFNIKY